jgi:hypothetical protein
MKKLAVLSVLAAAVLILGCDNGTTPSRSYAILIKEYYWTQSEIAQIEAATPDGLVSFDTEWSYVPQLAEISGAALAGNWSQSELDDFLKSLPSAVKTPFLEQLNHSGNSIMVFSDGWIYVEAN